MPITYTPAKTAVQAPGAPAAPNGANVLDAVDYNTINEGVAAVTTFANGLETTLSEKANTSDIPDVSALATKAELETLQTEVAGKADASAIPDVSGFQTAEQVNTAISAATADLASQGDLDALETLVGEKADTTALADYVQTTFLEANYTDTTDMTAAIDAKETEIKDFYSNAADAATAGAAEVGAYYDGAASTVQATIDALVARIAALESA